MTMPPTRFPTHSHHAVVVWTLDLAPAESGRLPETPADALGACRRALVREAKLPQPFRNAAPAVLERAATRLRSRRAVAEDCRAALVLGRKAAEGWMREHGAGSALEALAGVLADMVANAERVDHLLAAEAEFALRRSQLADDDV